MTKEAIEFNISGAVFFWYRAVKRELRVKMFFMEVWQPVV
jgi:hypothetical protein